MWILMHLFFNCSFSVQPQTGIIRMAGSSLQQAFRVYFIWAALSTNCDASSRERIGANFLTTVNSLVDNER